MTNVTACLSTLGLSAASLAGIPTIEAEFFAIRKAYFKLVLIHHPDKGGNADAFRAVNESFEDLRHMFAEKLCASFFSAATAEAAAPPRQSARPSQRPRAAPTSRAPPKPFEFYRAAAEELVPQYKVELAKSGRSQCQTTISARPCSANPFIAKDSIRVGSLDYESGTYSRWIHLDCWRVPQKIWQGVPDPDTCKDPSSFVEAISSMNEVLFCGFNRLSHVDQAKIVVHIMDKRHWANYRYKASLGGSHDVPLNRADSGFDGSFDVKQESGYNGKSSGRNFDRNTFRPHQIEPPSYIKQEHPIIQQQLAHRPPPPPSTSLARFNPSNQFIIPRPGINGADPNALHGHTIVLTGLFPEIGGGTGLNLGKDRLRDICESFGAKVRAAVSGKTTLLIVGKEPGISKVSKARETGCRLISVKDLVAGIEGRKPLEIGAGDSDDEPQIERFSVGYNGNGRAMLCSREEYEAAMGRDRERQRQQQAKRSAGRYLPYHY
ncbi:hypothetical protein HDU79_005174 [Rhizoclosmatium sp. JEL0117]|nr:hypothetical protein HDU79_005174 [Rhizoclosmatium sp. JEL0117]